jgi:hypothetical protein
MEQKNGFIPLRRGLDAHLDTIDGDALKLYLRLLIRARWRGQFRGCYIGKLKDLAASFKWSVDKLSRRLAQLSEHYIVIEDRGRGRGKGTPATDSVIRICRYDNKSEVRNSAELSESQVVPGAELMRVNSANSNGQVAPDAELFVHGRGVDSNQALETKADTAPEEGLRSKNNKERKKGASMLQSLTLRGKIWDDLSLHELPVEFAEFAELVEQNLPRPDERPRAWMNRVLDAWKLRSPHIKAPSRFLAACMAKHETNPKQPLVERAPFDWKLQISLKRLLLRSLDKSEQGIIRQLLKRVEAQEPLSDDDNRAYRNIYLKLFPAKEAA